MSKNSIRDRFVEIVPDFVVSTGAYVQYDVVGTLPVAVNGQGIVLRNVTNASGGCAKLTHIHMVENTGQMPSLSLYFFTTRPSGTMTDNGAVVWGTEDYKRRTGCVRITSGDWHTNPLSAPDASVDLSGIEQILASADDSRDIYMVMVADAAYDAGVESDLHIKLKFDRGGDSSR